MFYFVLFSLNRNFGYRRNYFRSDKEIKKTVFISFISRLFVTLRLRLEITFVRKRKEKQAFLLLFSHLIVTLPP